MLEILVRSRSDAKAVKAMLEKFYSDWSIDVKTLQGFRSFDKAYEVLVESISSDKFYIVLLGRRDRGLAEELDKVLPPNIAVHVVSAAKVRNMRIEHLAHEFDIARSMFRLAASWRGDKGIFVFGLRMGMGLEDYGFNPAYDPFLGIGDVFHHMLERVLGGSICRNPLLVRRFGGRHDIYCSHVKTAILDIPDEGFKPRGKILSTSFNNIDLEKMVRANIDVLKLYESISISFLKKFRDWADTVIVPWSGGKDSTATLILALRVFPKSRVRAVYVDTGTEFPSTTEYVEEISKKLGVEIVKLYAGIDRGLLVEGKPFPTHTNRWCTERKIKTLEKGISEIASGNTLIITGDRDAESRRRSIRPPVRGSRGEVLVVSPLKLWGATHVQLYHLWRGVPLNPLYLKGFYRIGCYICPALRSWERYIMIHDKDIAEKLKDKILYKEYILLHKPPKNKYLKDKNNT